MTKTFDIKRNCKHFNGIMNKVCLAGVLYESVRNEKGSLSDRNVYPCFEGTDCEIVCLKREWMTQEDVEEREKDIANHVQKMVENSRNGGCMICGEQVEYMIQVHQAMYAHPCNHRMGVGSAERWNKANGKVSPKGVHTFPVWGLISEWE